MKRKRYPPDDPREWFSRAHSNLAAARVVVPGVVFEDLCFSAQQAVEKAIKAVMIHRHIRFPYVHDIDRLLKILKHDGVNIPKYVWQADDLTLFAFETRYPGTSADVTKRVYSRAVRVAEAVVAWAERQVNQP